MLIFADLAVAQTPHGGLSVDVFRDGTVAPVSVVRSCGHRAKDIIAVDYAPRLL